MWTPLKCGPHWNVDSTVHMWTWQHVDMSICPHFSGVLHLDITSIIFILGLSSLTLFLCTQDCKAIGVNRCFIRTCARPHARKTCSQRFWPNSANFYRINLNFSVFWDAEKNANQCAGLFSSSMSSFPVAGVFTIRRFTLYLAKFTTACACTVSIMSELMI